MKISNSVIFGDPEIYAGWPANNGGWQWGNEVLVGFLTGKFDTSYLHHAIAPPFENRLARTTDGGVSWDIEICPNFSRSEPARNGLITNDAILRLGGSFGHGGINSFRGNVYSSEDKGKTWIGPVDLAVDGIKFTKKMRCTTRTAFIENNFYMTHGRGGFGTDAAFVATRIRGGSFSFNGYIESDGCRAVMPSPAVMGNRVFCAIRRSDSLSYWIEVYEVVKGVWESIGRVYEAYEHNGNPPSLISYKGRLYCFYANRDKCSIVMAVSNNGMTWENYDIRQGCSSDIGYAKAFAFDDHIGVAYYFSDDISIPPHIAWTCIEWN